MYEIMKTLFRSVIALAAAAVAICSCNKDLNEGISPKGVKVDFIAQAPATKAVFGELSANQFPVLWQAGDKVKLSVGAVGGGKSIRRGVGALRVGHAVNPGEGVTSGLVVHRGGGIQDGDNQGVSAETTEFVLIFVSLNATGVIGLVMPGVGVVGSHRG